MKARIYVSDRKLEFLSQAINEMNDDDCSIYVDCVHKDPSDPEFHWVSLAYESVEELFYLGCYVGGLEMAGLDENK